MRSGPCASRKSRASLRAVGRFEAATESSRSRISASAPDSRPRASFRSLSAGTNSIERIGGVLLQTHYLGTVTGLVPVTHVLFWPRRWQDVDGRAKPGQGGS